MNRINRTLHEGNRKKLVKRRIVAAVVLGVLLATATINANVNGF
jgi:hypothetical protein